METRSRTLVKAVVWQALGLLTMTLVGWAITGSVAVGGGMAVINAGIGFCAYVLHERFWSGVRWGRMERTR